MQRTDIKAEEYSSLLGRIGPIVLEKGLKSTTMDFVASRLGMSKRTLYEIFGSKDEMIKVVLTELEKHNQEFVDHTFATTDNVLEALIKIFLHNRDRLQSTNAEFFRDLDLYKDKRETYDQVRKNRHKAMLRLFDRGIREGMFRPDVDYNIQSRIMNVQMESLKKTEDYFPADIPLIRVFDAIIVGFLRSIASEKGMRILDQLTAEIEPFKRQ